MTPRVGDVVRASTTDVIGHETRFKHHLCVHAAERQHLLISTRAYRGDLPISPDQCAGLDHDSHVSLSRVLFVQRFAKGATVTCTVSDDYLLALFEHAKASRVMSEVDRRKVLTGIAAHFC